MDIKKIIIPQKKTKKIVTYDDVLLQSSQEILLNKLYLNIPFKNNKNIINALKHKLSSYRSQDIKKKKLSIEFIPFEKLIEKLVISKMKCYYCRCPVLLTYNNIRDNRQWTLDRLNNDKGHNTNNVVIACLQCNLQRGVKNNKKFLFTKQMRIIKKDRFDI